MTPEQLFAIFHGRAVQRANDARAAKTRFAYYTTAATAREVIRNGEVWMRLPTCMNDWSEVQHGLTVFQRAWGSFAGSNLRSALEALEPGCADQVIDQVLNQSARLLFSDTFIACLSEHLPTDDQYGRLSMWRAYGGGSGVAIVINPDVIHSEDDGLGAYSSPIEYFDQGNFDAEFDRLAGRLNANQAALKALPPGELFGWMLNSAIAAVLSVKHPAFAEEREWRMFSANADERGRLRREVETINGIPQPVLKLPINDRRSGVPNGLSLDALIHKVLIGPTQYPVAIAEGLVTLLEDAGVSRPGDRVHVTGVPLRMPG